MWPGSWWRECERRGPTVHRDGFAPWKVGIRRRSLSNRPTSPKAEPRGAGRGGGPAAPRAQVAFRSTTVTVTFRFVNSDPSLAMARRTYVPGWSKTTSTS